MTKNFTENICDLQFSIYKLALLLAVIKLATRFPSLYVVLAL